MQAAMKVPRRSVLIVGVDRREFEQVLPFLERQTFEIDRFPSAAGALELLAQVAFEVLIVRFPLPDMDPQLFLGTVRSRDSACLHSPIVLLVADGYADEAERFIGRGANRIVHISDPAAKMQQAITSLLNVAPRKAARFLARLEVRVEGSKDMILCETENISASGMLIKTDRDYEKGMTIRFEFSLPDDSRPVVGIAEVVRHTHQDRDPIQGIGVRFISFAGDSQRRFEAFLGRQ